MLGLKLNHVSKRGHSRKLITDVKYSHDIRNKLHTGVYGELDYSKYFICKPHDLHPAPPTPHHPPRESAGQQRIVLAKGQYHKALMWAFNVDLKCLLNERSSYPIYETWY